MKDQINLGPPDPGQEISCTDFDLLLSDAMDGLLTGPALASFQRHVASCRTCGPIFADTQSGLHWLKSLEPVAPPSNLVHNILAVTTLQESTSKAQARKRESWSERLARILGPVVGPVYKTVMQPRFALNAAMAFFSITLLLNVGGVKLTGVHLSDLNPSAIKTNISLKYDETTARVVKYYENIRFVYELQSTVRELKRATTNNNEQPENSSPKKKEDNTTQKPDKDRNENYVREQNGIVLAALHTDGENSEIGAGLDPSLFEMGIKLENSCKTNRRLA